MPYQAFEIKATASALAAPAEGAERTQLLFQAREKVQKLNSHLDALLLRIRDLHSSTTDNERLSLYREFEDLCRSRKELIDELKASGFFQNEELRVNLRLGARIRVQITAKLTNLLGSFKDARLRGLAAGLLAKTLADFALEFDAAFVLQIELDRLTEEFARTCSELEIVFETDAPSGSGSGGGAYVSFSTSGSVDTGTSRDGLSYALLEIFQEHDPTKVILQIIEETHRIERELMEEAAERKQQERLLEVRLEEKAEDEREEQEQVRQERHAAALAAAAAEYRQQNAVGYFDEIDAEINRALIELDLRRLQMQEESQLAA